MVKYEIFADIVMMICHIWWNMMAWWCLQIMKMWANFNANCIQKKHHSRLSHHDNVVDNMTNLQLMMIFSKLTMFQSWRWWLYLRIHDGPWKQTAKERIWASFRVNFSLWGHVGIHTRVQEHLEGYHVSFEIIFLGGSYFLIQQKYVFLGVNEYDLTSTSL